MMLMSTQLCGLRWFWIFMIGLLLSTQGKNSYGFSPSLVPVQLSSSQSARPLIKNLRRSSLNTLHSSVNGEPTPKRENNNLRPNGDSKNIQEAPVETERPKRPLVRLIDNFWFVMCAPFPDLRKLARKRDDDSKFVVSIRLRDGLAAVLVYLGVGVLSYHYFFEKWSIIDSLYFACTCFSTVGYGDLAPHTKAGKVFTCVFGLAGIALLGAAVATIGSRLVQAEIESIKLARKESQKQLMHIYDKMPALVKSLRQKNSKEQRKFKLEAAKLMNSLPRPHFPPPVKNAWKAARYIVQSLSVVVLGGLLIGKLEGWSWYDSMYYSLITASTIGLGDFAPCTRAGRLAAVVVIPMSVAAAGELLASVGLAIVERRQKKVFHRQLNRGLTMENLHDMDTNHDGKVMREEYVLFMLMEMGLVNKQEIEELWSQFDRLDVTRSGYLDHEDLMLMAKLRSAGLIES